MENVHDILKVLSFMHEGLNMVHRDIKPSNVMYDSNFEIKVVDFGISKHLISETEEGEKVKLENTTTTGFAGTLGYMAPELV